MRKPSANIPDDLRSKDEILDSFVELLDDAYVKFYDELFKMTNWVHRSTVPDELLDYLLYEQGFAVFEGYNATQKRNLLDKSIEIDSKRYTKQGLTIYVNAILPDLYVDVEIPYQLNELSFRRPAVGFPNTEMRQTAGRERGDINPYIFNKDQQDIITVFLFAPDSNAVSNYTDGELFDFLETVIPSQLPDIIPNIQFQVLKYEYYTEDVTVDGNTVTGSTTTDFDTYFSVGDYIGLGNATDDNALAFEISSITPSDGTTNDELTIDSSYDPVAELGITSGDSVSYYVPYQP